MKQIAKYFMMIAVADGSALAEPALQDKTLVAWAAPSSKLSPMIGRP